jgi:hypothetical protein
MTFPPPTIVDVIERAVMAMNDLVIYGVINCPETLTPGQREYIVDADWKLNSVHDAVTDYWGEG